MSLSYWEETTPDPGLGEKDKGKWEFKMTYPSAKTSLCHPDSFPSKSPVTFATQFYCHLLERHGGGHVQTTQILYLDSSKTASKNCVP